MDVISIKNDHVYSDGIHQTVMKIILYRSQQQQPDPKTIRRRRIPY